jgi:NAD(P)-dependent dehydrogenase (short-subunit alcohol dehydrogenase family)
MDVSGREGEKFMAKPVAVVVGVGAELGVGAAVCRRFGREGHHVLVAGRTLAKIEKVAEAIEKAGGSAAPALTDATREKDVIALFDAAMALGPGFAPAEVVVFNAGNNQRLDFRELDAAAFEDFWRVGCFAGFLVGREAARRLAPLGRGSVIFTGASGSLRGKPGFAHFAAAKAGLRMIAQSMAREYGPLGLHVAHVVIDGGIDGERLRRGAPQMVAARGEDGLLGVEAIAETYWQIHRQPRSAWTQEVDLRPFKETF